MFSPSPSYTYNDIGLVPRNLSHQTSRSQTDTKMTFLEELELSLPILLAPMETVVGYEMSLAINLLGGLCVIPRTGNGIAIADPERYVPSISIRHEPKFKHAPPAVCIDVANGFHIDVAEMVAHIKETYPHTSIIAGNVASVEGYKWLSELGVDAVRVGIGGGSVCTTSVATGVGVGQASIVRDIAVYRQKNLGTERGAVIIADGGIKNPGDVVKAIALGADVVMAGGIFGGCKETPGRVLKVEDRHMKHLAGQASMYIKGQNTYVEGADKVVPYSGPVARTWKAFREGIESGMAYMDCNNLEELRYLGDEYFVYLSDAAKAERNVHA